MTEDGKVIYRNSELDPIAVWDTVGKKWLTPEQAGVVWTTEVWKQKLSEPIVDALGRKDVILPLMYINRNLITSVEEIGTHIDGNAFLIFEPSGIITVGGDLQYVTERFNAGATIFTLKERSVMSPLFDVAAAVRIAGGMYNNGNREVRVEFGQFESGLRANISTDLSIKSILTITLPDGTVVTPILSMPKDQQCKLEVEGGTYFDRISTQEVSPDINEVNWLDEMYMYSVTRK